MDTTTPSLNTLFQQLGLKSNDSDIDQFIRQHKLHRRTLIEDAPFWSSSQAQFLKEERRQDGNWSEVIDYLDGLLHK